MSFGGDARNVFAKEHTGHITANRLELTAELARSIGLEVPDILMGGSSEEENDNAGLSSPPRRRPPRRWRRGLKMKQVRQRQSQCAQPAGAEPFSASHPLA